MIEPSITQALRIWTNWTGDCSPISETGNRDVDLRLADAFRVLLLQRDTDSRLRFLEREIMRDPIRRRVDDPYAAELTRWFLDIYEEEAAAGRLVAAQ